jgi:hypothetical protein
MIAWREAPLMHSVLVRRLKTRDLAPQEKLCFGGELPRKADERDVVSCPNCCAMRAISAARSALMDAVR